MSAARCHKSPIVGKLETWARLEAKRHGLDGSELFQDAQVAFWQKEKRLPATDDDASLFRGIIKNVRKRTLADAARHPVCKGEPEESSGSAFVRTNGRGVAALNHVGKDAVSRCWERELLPILTEGQPESGLMQLIYGRLPLLLIVIRRFLTVVSSHEVDGEHGTALDPAATIYRDLSPRELEHEVRRVAEGMSEWIGKRFPLRGVCPACGRSTFALDCEQHPIRSLLGVPGTPSAAEGRGEATHRSWSGWHVPEGDETMRAYREAFEGHAERSGLLCQLEASAYRAPFDDCSSRFDAAERVAAMIDAEAAEAKMLHLSDELNQRFERRFLFGAEDARREHRLSLAARAFLLEMCRLARVNPSHVDELDVARREENTRQVTEFLAELRLKGDATPRYTRKPGRPKKRVAPKTRQRRPGNAQNIG